MSRRPTYQHGIKSGRICEWPEDADTPDEVAERVTYTGNPKHKSYPSLAGSPALQADAAKCDHYERRHWPLLLDALRQAIRCRCVGQFRGNYPSRAWVWINDVLHEARLTTEGQGDYHGFPINDARQYPEPLDLLERAPHVQIPNNPV
jgi:hypothetical protein